MCLLIVDYACDGCIVCLSGIAGVLQSGDFSSMDFFDKVLKRPHMLLQKARQKWRNWLARQTVNLEVGSSTLPGGVLFANCTFSFARNVASDC